VPKPSKIEKYGLEEKVLALRYNDKNNVMSYNDIAKTISKKSGHKISTMAVKRFIDKHEQSLKEKAPTVIKEDKRRITKSLNQTYDVIQSQLDISNRVLEKLDKYEDIEAVLERVIQSAECYDSDKMDRWLRMAVNSLQNNIYSFTALTKEVRENNKFLADLQSKIYDFSILQEFVYLFIEEFKKKDPQLTLEILRELKTNKRIRRIIESSEGDEFKRNN